MLSIPDAAQAAWFYDSTFMAYLDKESGSISLQVVYDGAPHSGKTSSLVALGRLFDRHVITPEEREGRTMFFDWLDYTGGECRGRPIQCRIIAVPGQAEYGRRREVILKGADTIVLIVDSSAAAFSASVAHFESLKSNLESWSLKVPIVLQLNKRDAEDALPVPQILSALDSSLVTLETIAPDGTGIRESFVLAVGAAVRSLRASADLYSTNLFDTQEIQAPSPEQLFELLKHQ